MSSIEKIEALISDPNFAGAYDLEEKHRFEIEDSHLGEYLEGKLEIAKSMLKDNVDVEVISKYTSLSIDEINSLLNN